MTRDRAARHSANPIREVLHAAAHGYNFRLTCRSCGHAEILNRFAVWWLFRENRWRDLIADVPPRFRCGNCGSKRPGLDLVQKEPTTHALTLPAAAEQEWKRELRRRR